MTRKEEEDEIRTEVRSEVGTALWGGGNFCALKSKPYIMSAFGEGRPWKVGNETLALSKNPGSVYSLNKGGRLK